MSRSESPGTRHSNIFAARWETARSALECGDLSPLSIAAEPPFDSLWMSATPRSKESGSATTESGDKSPHSKVACHAARSGGARSKSQYRKPCTEYSSGYGRCKPRHTPPAATRRGSRGPRHGRAVGGLRAWAGPLPASSRRGVRRVASTNRKMRNGNLRQVCSAFSANSAFQKEFSKRFAVHVWHCRSNLAAVKISELGPRWLAALSARGRSSRRCEVFRRDVGSRRG